MATIARPITARARHARTVLEQRLLAAPEVRLIDIGLEPVADAPGKRTILRVHLAAGTDRRSLAIPEHVDGIPVRVVTGDYRPG
jgi:hypothetical protein